MLRLQSGDRIQVFDGAGRRFEATLGAAGRDRCELAIGAELDSPPPSPLRITLVQALSAAEKMDWAIEKAVELGVTAIVPVIAARSIVRLDAARAERRREHWQRLVIAACMQCGRDILPQVHAVVGLDDWFEGLVLPEPDPRPAHRLILTPPAAGLNALALSAWADALSGGAAIRQVTVLVGPESGFSDPEVTTAQALGFQPIALGLRVLRTETAGLALLAALQVKLGDF